MIINAKERNITGGWIWPVGGWGCHFRWDDQERPHQGKNQVKPPRRREREPD